MYIYISPDNKYSIITAPRAGSTTLENTFSMNRASKEALIFAKHVGYIPADNGWDITDDATLNTEYSIAILRHPVSRLWSAWKMANKQFGDKRSYMEEHTKPWIYDFYVRCERVQKFPYIIPFSKLSNYFPKQYGVSTGSECMEYDDQALHLIRWFIPTGEKVFNREIEYYEKLQNRCEVLSLELFHQLRETSYE